jgi:hypothetical protein
MRTPAFLLGALLVTSLATPTDAQELDGQWFKVVAVGNGVGVDAETGDTGKFKSKKAVRYARCSFNEGGIGVSYSLQVFNPTEEGAWVPNTGGSLNMVDDGETFVLNSNINLFHRPVPDEEGAPNLLLISFNGPVKTKFKKKELKSSRISTLGATAEITSETSIYYGKAKVTLTRIPESKLPDGLGEMEMGGAPVVATSHSAAEGTMAEGR